MDDNVGELVRFLNQQGLKDDTAIVFYSDHGELMGSHGLMEKKVPYEESVGVPLIISYPQGGVVPGKVFDVPVSTIDLLPTIRGLAGLKPDSANPGIDLVPLITGNVNALSRQGVLLEGMANLKAIGLTGEGPWRGWRTSRFKYTVLGDALGGSPWQLYDLHNDPYELTNLINHPDSQSTARELHGALRESMIQSEDHFPLVPAYGYDGLNLGFH